MRTTSEETQRNNQIIIEAAIKVFAEKGYEAANMQDIANEANITRGPLYYRYKTKADLFQAAVKVHANRELQEYKRIFSQDKHILGIIREDLYYCTRSIRLSQPFLTVSDAEELKNSYKILKDARKKIYSIKEDSITKAIDKGELVKTTNPSYIVNLLFVFVDGLYQFTQKTEITFPTNMTEEIIEDLMYVIENRYCKNTK